MSYFLSSMLHQFLLPVILLAWLLRTQSCRAAAMFWPIAAAIGLALAVGSLPASTALHLVEQAGYLSLLLLALPAILWSPWRWLPAAALLLLVLLASYRWLSAPQLETLTRTDVINSELILNLAAILAGVALLGGIFALVRQLGRRLPRATCALALLGAILLALPLSGELLLSLIKLELLALSKTRLSYISLVTNFAWATTYLGLAALALLVLYWTLRHVGRQPAPGDDAILDWRKQTAAYRERRRLGRAGIGLTVVCVGALLYWDLWASRPPSLSAATRVELADDGLLHLPVEPFRDGKLHRFAWVADDGKLVRFFVINRYTDRLKLGVVFDACMLCGDQGYILQGNQVICVACGVRIFTPSIGKPSGCNPIPMEQWQVQNGELQISRATLETGLRYFSTVLEIEVRDPVDGQSLTNTDAPYRYSYSGKTWFFASEANYEAFRADPGRYSGEL